MKTLMYTICLILVLVVSASTVNAELVAHWTFDEGSGATAYDSAGSNNGTVNGATWTTGPSAGALSFNPSNYASVNVPDDPSLRFSQSSSFSIAFWANVTTGGEIISKMRASGQHGFFGYEIQYSGGSTKAFRFIGESSYRGQTFVSTGTNSAVSGNWYHVAAIYDNKDIKMYLNGILKGSGTFAYNTGTTSPDGYLGIGARVADNAPMSGFYFSGSLDDMRIYNEALSADNVMQLYQTTPEPATLALLGLGGMMLRRRG